MLLVVSLTQQQNIFQIEIWNIQNDVSHRNVVYATSATCILKEEINRSNVTSKIVLDLDT